ncbi:hypothetical protein PMG11_10570 [Penicillium brasilianum]|uniref:Uncharacterized protein n=1 Tax=Penicillium brasilianum TaxID=104259 RepID=A0A0F7U3V6_PENBI|nr:hypothetical protein PMG11_10570 [Penicillium brasilianum]
MPPSVPDPHDRSSGTRTPREDLDLVAFKKWEVYSVDLLRVWDFAKEGFKDIPKNVRLSDEAAFAISVFMPRSLRAIYYPYDFDSHGDLREFRIAQDPPMIIQCHGINWFPVYRGVNILCGSWWPACGWLRGVDLSPEYGYTVGEYAAPPEAVEACTTPFQLNSHQLRPSPSGVSPDMLLLGICPPVSLEDAISRQGIALTMDIEPRRIAVIGSKATYCIRNLTKIKGFHYLAGPTSDPKDSSQSIHRHRSSKKVDLQKVYGGPYKNFTTTKAQKNWEGDATVQDTCSAG